MNEKEIKNFDKREYINNYIANIARTEILKDKLLDLQSEQQVIKAKNELAKSMYQEWQKSLNKSFLEEMKDTFFCELAVFLFWLPLIAILALGVFAYLSK